MVKSKNVLYGAYNALITVENLIKLCILNAVPHNIAKQYCASDNMTAVWKMQQPSITIIGKCRIHNVPLLLIDIQLKSNLIVFPALKLTDAPLQSFKNSLK